jgi:hypothetical protein
MSSWMRCTGSRTGNLRLLNIFRERTAQALVGESWVVDGNYSLVHDITWERADTIVWLDYALPLILARLTRRTF